MVVTTLAFLGEESFFKKLNDTSIILVASHTSNKNLS